MDPIDLAWSGFRGFRHRVNIRLPRFTLLIGRNNVGKSSAYAPLLMLRQTLDARSPETALLSRGDLVDVGPFRDYVSDHDVDRSVTFRVGLPSHPRVALLDRANPLRLGAVEVTFKSEDGQTAYLARQRIEDPTGAALVSRSREHPDSAFTVTSTLLPTANQGRPTREMTALRTALRQEQPRGFLFAGYGALILPRSIREDKERWAKVQDWYQASYDLYDVQRHTNDLVERFLFGLSYVGPLRSLPLRTYRLAPEAPLEVGGTGEFAPEVLYRLQHQEAGEIVDSWLAKLGYGQLHFEPLSDEYFQVQLEWNQRRVNIADSGVGLSQVLPLLVQASLAASGDTVIAQQPEIHLNPAQQSIVTDFLIERAAADVRVVVESHSEHVLLRLRRRIAEGTIDAADVAVYFVDNVGGQTRMGKLPLGEAGQIERDEWPNGFFEEQLNDSFALAAAQSMRANR